MTGLRTSVMSRGSSGISEYTNLFSVGCEGEDEDDLPDPTGWGERENNQQKIKKSKQKSKPKGIHKGDMLKAVGWLLGSASR